MKKKLKPVEGSADEDIKEIEEAVDAKLICKHKGLIPDSNVKACQPI